MTKLKIISRLWGHIVDLRLIINSSNTKSIAQIEAELDITELYCRKYVDIDDIQD